MFKYLLPICVILVHLASSTFGQDGHYWSENYGNRSMLLSGTVIGSVNDLGAVFYNPGRLGLIDNPAFVISAKVYLWSNLRIEDGVDEGVDLNKTKFGGAPSLVAGTFRFPFLEGHRFAYSLLTRSAKDVDFSVRVEKEGDITEAIDGDELFIGKFNFDSNFKEEWFGLTWAPPAINNLSFGLSTFVTSVNKSSLIELDMNAINDQNEGGYYSRNRRYSFESIAVLWKAGLALDLQKVNLGLTVTTPQVNVLGKGSTLFEEYLVGIDTTGDGNKDDGLIYNMQNNLNIQYKSPIAVGLGVGIPFNKGIIHLSGEWYNRMNKYTVMHMEPFAGQSTGDTVRFVLVDELDHVFNYGIGAEIHFSEKFAAYASIATDYSAVPKEIERFTELEDQTNTAVFQTDFFKFGGGVSIETKDIEITVGATYKGASQSFKQTIDFPPAQDNTTTKLIFNEWRFILGFSFPFAEKLTKKLDGVD